MISSRLKLWGEHLEMELGIGQFEPGYIIKACEFFWQM